MEKRGLGRGLAALISDTLSEDTQPHVQEIPLDQIVANPFQPRTLFDPLKQEELVASIRQHGVLQPVLLRRVGHERYQLVAGERRFRATQASGLATIPALIKECTDSEQLEIAIVENVQREDIGAMEAARAYKRMSEEFGMTQETIAQRVGKSRTAITNSLGLLDLPETVQESIERGEISEGHARALKTIRDPFALLRTWELVVKKGLSVRETEKLSREVRSPASAPAAAPTGNTTPSPSVRQSASMDTALQDPNAAYYLNQLQSVLQTKVTLRHGTGGSGRIEIEFYSPEDLERIVELMFPAGISPK
ncbi:MAG TPA: ParB/RepB/Spo0J family partition protein [Chthonomonadaceae bacterium]|nr:ParB/RepB/Spo0J family partition protein [Chthonomonadaceae bacterium]